jgi:four helix bundle protein
MDLAEGVYQVSRSWLAEEVYGLTAQARRAAVSVIASIAEGKGRTGVREYLHHRSIRRRLVG